MKLEAFKAGRWMPRYQYKSFEPVPVNHDWTWEDARVHVLLEQANRALGELNAFSLIVPDIDLFIEMHLVKEAQTSSRIEGTQTGIEEAVLSEDQIRPEKRDDWREVRNYVAAMNQAIVDLKQLPLSNRLLCGAHARLMQGVRGEHKQPGEFRRSQNWIGGSSLAHAAFIRPAHDGVPALIETIHPFIDANGAGPGAGPQRQGHLDRGHGPDAGPRVRLRSLPQALH